MSERLAEFVIGSAYIRVYQDSDARLTDTQRRKLLNAIQKLCAKFGDDEDFERAKSIYDNA